MHRPATASLAVCALLAACAAPSPTAEPQRLEGTAWLLYALPGQAVPAPGRGASLRFEAGRAQGTDGCNRYDGPYVEEGGTLTVGPGLAATQVGCAPEVAAQAEAFVGALTRANAYRIEGGRLELVGGDGNVLATLLAQSRALAGTTWRVTGYNDGKHAVVNVLPGTELTLAFASDDTASGSAGCNHYTAGYATDGQRLKFGPAAATRRACAEPEGVMEQEAQYLRALASVASARALGDHLELRTGTGVIAATLAREGG